jgi:hypothetical protein
MSLTKKGNSVENYRTSRKILLVGMESAKKLKIQMDCTLEREASQAQPFREPNIFAFLLNYFEALIPEDNLSVSLHGPIGDGECIGGRSLIIRKSSLSIQTHKCNVEFHIVPRPPSET